MSDEVAAPSYYPRTAAVPASPSQTAVMLLFGFTVFCSAFLLFQVQLIIAKYILPWFGGTPAIFTTCILFFQILLLLGYSYAYILDVSLSPRSQALVHTLLILFAIGLLIFRLSRWGSPLLPDSGWKPIDSERPFLRVIGLLFASVGLPYFLVSTTGPLVQAWFTRVCANSPYRLYALSNAGSLIALLSYPVVIEPALHLRVQAGVWGVVFVLFGISCLAIAWKAAGRPVTLSDDPSRASLQRQSSSSSLARKVAWLLLAATGSLSLLATTNRVCQDVAVVPLLWVLPLSIYLLSFVVCFSSEKLYSRNTWSLALGLAAVLVCFALYHENIGVIWQIAIYSFALLATCMVCHGELADLKPPKEYLTSFYLFVAAGGALGGVFVSIVAPLIFKGFWEFHLSVWISCLLFCLILLRDTRSWLYWPRPLLLAFCVLVVFAGPGLAAIGSKPLPLLLACLLVGGLVVFLCSGSTLDSSLRQRRRAAVFSLSFTAVLLALILFYSPFVNQHGAVASARNFYGVLTVTSDAVDGNPRLVLRHGRITHGFQFSDEVKAQTPTTYYTPQSGIGLVLTNYPGRTAGRVLNIGVIGLGVGTIAAYGIPGDRMIFYEINPDVIRIAGASPEKLFTFVSKSRAEIQVVPGDARISLEHELNRNEIGNFDVLVIDAFSGDAIPVHLLTEEAFQLYLRHLRKPNGILAFHISNGALDLRPVVAKLAAESGMSAWLAQSDSSYKSVWVIVAAQNRDAPIPGVSHMTPINASPGFPLWTDDYSNLLRVLRW